MSSNVRFVYEVFFQLMEVFSTFSLIFGTSAAEMTLATGPPLKDCGAQWSLIGVGLEDAT